MPETMQVVVGLGDQVHKQHLARMQEAAPGARFIHETDEREQLKVAPETDVFIGWPADDFLAAATKLRWIQLASAGVDRYVRDARLRERGILLTNASGVFGPCIAEHVMGLLLGFSRGIANCVRQQLEHKWGHPGGVFELVGKTLLVVGLGDIGREVAVRAGAFGMNVIGVKRSMGPKPPQVQSLHTIDELDALLPKADVVVISLPLTAGTRGLFDRKRLGRLKKSAIIINIGRGAIIDEAAMIERLQAGELGGAGLDVFEKEPLPPTSPLWDLPNVIVSPHLSGRTPAYRERFAEIVCDNLRRFVSGEPMRNVVDWERGY